MRNLPGLIVLGALIVAAAGCNEPTERLNAPPQGAAKYPSKMQDAFVYMVDNAMLEDLSLADVHFVPHTVELNGLGAKRLERYAKLLTVYGGAIRYATDMTDEPIVERRLASIRSYLATTGIETDRIKVVKEMPGGVGMPAEEAIAAKAANIGGGAAKDGKKGGMTALGSLLGGGP